MDFSKGAMLVSCSGQFAGTRSDGGGAADGAGVAVLPGLTVKSPRVEVSKPQRAALTAAVL